MSIQKTVTFEMCQSGQWRELTVPATGIRCDESDAGLLMLLHGGSWSFFNPVRNVRVIEDNWL